MNSMKLLRSVHTITKAIIVAGLLGACQNEKDAVVSPIAEQVNQSNNQKANFALYFKRLIADDKVM